MSFTLTPPIVLKKNIGFSVIQAGDMALAESLIINMAGWSAIDLLKHWRSEIGECLAGRRDRCCIVSGLIIKADKVIPSEWWTLYFIEGQVKLHYQILSFANADAWKASNEWWENILPYDQNVSEWILTSKELTEWCDRCDVLLSAIVAVQDD